MDMSDVNIRGSWLKGLRELSTIFVNLKFLQNIKKKVSMFMAMFKESINNAYIHLFNSFYRYLLSAFCTVLGTCSVAHCFSCMLA